MKEVELGAITCTRGIDEEFKKNPKFYNFAMNCLFQRYLNNDWGEMCAEDKCLNDSAVENGDDRIFASYEIPEELGMLDEKIWIITEWDRSVTTILFPEEY